MTFFGNKEVPSYTAIKYMDKGNKEIAKGTAHIVVELIEYKRNEVVTKTIMQRATGSISALAFANGEGLNEKTSPYDTYIQIIDGSAHIVIDGRATTLLPGHGLIIPAHRASHIKPNGPFKMIQTVIKSGYEAETIDT